MLDLPAGTGAGDAASLRIALLYAPFAYNSNAAVNIALRFAGRHSRRVFHYRALTRDKLLKTIDRFQFQIFPQRWPADARHNRDVWLQSVVPGW